MEHSCNYVKYIQCEVKHEAELYKRLYEVSKSGLTDEERQLIIELICNEQLLHILPKSEDSHESKRYNELEHLKAKIKIV